MTQSTIKSQSRRKCSYFSEQKLQADDLPKKWSSKEQENINIKNKNEKDKLLLQL